MASEDMSPRDSDGRETAGSPSPIEPDARDEGDESEDRVPPGAIVVGVDGSDRDETVLAFATRVATRIGAPLHLVMAHEIHTGVVGSWDAGFIPSSIDSELATASERALAAKRAELVAANGGLSVTTSHPWATPSQALLDAAEAARLVVVGTGRKRGLERAVLGTTSLDTAMHAPSPVAVVGNSTGETGPVVVGIDGSKHSALAAQWAADAAVARDVPLIALCTWWLEVIDGMVVTEPGTPQWQQVEDRYRQVVEEALRPVRAAHPDLEIDVRLLNARPVDVLVETAGPDGLIVVGSRGRGGFAGMALGSVSHKVLQRATAPVVVTRAVAEPD